MISSRPAMNQSTVESAGTGWLRSGVVSIGVWAIAAPLHFGFVRRPGLGLVYWGLSLPITGACLLGLIAGIVAIVRKDRRWGVSGVLLNVALLAVVWFWPPRLSNH
jgi:hypothetical protein